MKPLKFTISALAASVFLVACGGGGNSAGNPATGGVPVVETVQLEGVGIDGYLQNAAVCIDLNENLVCDSNEPSAVTGAGGAYTLDATQDGRKCQRCVYSNCAGR